MKSILVLSFSVVLVSTALPTEKKCSEENLLALLRLATNLLGEASGQNIKTTQLLHSQSNKKLTLAEIRTKHLVLAKEKQDLAQDSLKKVDQLIKANPECDIDGMFSAKK